MRGLLDTKVSIPSANIIAKNTQNAIDNYSLGPVNPSVPDTPYWNKMAKVFRITPAEVKRQRCANCEYYDNTPAMFEAMESIPQNKYDLYDGQAQRGFCHKLMFICHTSRLCSVWEEKEFIEPEMETD